MDGSGPLSFSPHHRTRIAAFAACAIACAGTLALAQTGVTMIAIAQMNVGAPPAGFKFARTGQGAVGQWTVVADETASGGRAIAPELALESWSGGEDPLSERERQVLRMAGEGRSGAEIARQLSLSEGTVRNYLSEAISKLDAGNRVEAFRLAREAGWL